MRVAARVPPRPRAGFTVLEAAVALALTGIALAAGYAGVSTLTEARRAGAEANAAVVRSANVRSTLAGWLRSTVVLLEADADAEGAHPRHRLAFVTASAGELWPSPSRIRLRVDLDPATPARGLVAELTPLDGRAGGREVLELAPRATGLQVHYLVDADGRRGWVRRWKEGQGLPRAVRLRILETASVRLGPRERTRPEARLPPLLRRPVIVPLEAGRW